MDFDLGDDLKLQCSQVFVHEPGERNFAYYLYLSNKDKYRRAQFVLSYPLRYQYVYVYGLKGDNILFVKKKGQRTWQLPGGEIKMGEIPEEAAEREFHEETGHNINILQSIETSEDNKLAFVAKIGNKTTDPIDIEEIEEMRFFGIEQLPGEDALTFPDTGYNKTLSEIREYL